MVLKRQNEKVDSQVWASHSLPEESDYNRTSCSFMDLPKETFIKLRVHGECRLKREYPRRHGSHTSHRQNSFRRPSRTLNKTHDHEV